MAGDPWGLDVADSGGATLHAVTAGTAWLRVPGQRPRQLMPGDIVLLPVGAGHVVASAATGPAVELGRVAKVQLRTPAANCASAATVPGPGSCVSAMTTTTRSPSR